MKRSICTQEPHLANGHIAEWIAQRPLQSYPTTCCLGFLALAAACLRGVPSQATLRHREGVKGVRASMLTTSETEVAVWVARAQELKLQ